MSTASASRAEPILVWDLPVRIFHWLLVACFAGAWLTAESESWRLVHVTLGYTMAALVGFRLLWGVIGSRHARFAQFVRGPGAVLDYLKSIGRGRPQHFTGHNPAGAVAIVALLALALVVTATGWANFESLGGEWLEEAHEAAANVMLGLVFVHLAGVAIGSVLHRENLVRSMVTGRKLGPPSEAIRSPRWGWALVLLAIVTGLWWFQSQQARSTHPTRQRATAATSTTTTDHAHPARRGRRLAGRRAARRPAPAGLPGRLGAHRGRSRSRTA